MTDKHTPVIRQDRIDISTEIRGLCRLLRARPSDVAEIIFRPTEAIVTTYIAGENGGKAIDPDSGEAVTETKTYRVRT